MQPLAPRALIAETDTADRIRGVRDALDVRPRDSTMRKSDRSPVSGERLPPLSVRPRQAARLIGVAEPTLEAWRRIGKGPRYLKLGRSLVLCRVSDLEAWLAGGAS